MSNAFGIDASQAAVKDPLVVSFKAVHKAYCSRFKRPVHALRGFTLDVPKGAILGLLGPNGCGKTTALSCLLGLLWPQSGSIHLWGKEVDLKPSQDLSRTYGVILEDTKLPPFLSVRAAVLTACRLRGLSGKPLEAEFDRLVDHAGIENLLEKRVNVLSKGQARRAGLAVAMAGDPPLLVMDEPSAGLDVDARVEFNGLVRKLRDGQRTMIIASHLLSDVESTCTHVAIMRDGKNIFFKDIDTLHSERGKKNIFVDKRYLDTLKKLDLSHVPSRFRNMVIIKSDAPDYETLSKLSKEKVVPEIIEPRDDLLSLYFKIAGEDEKA